MSDTPTSPVPVGPGGAARPTGAVPPAGSGLPGNRAGGTGSTGGPGSTRGPGGGGGGGGSGPGGGGPGPGATTPASQPDPVDRTITTVGGSVVARCVGSTASILSTSPLAGFAVSNLNRGPASQVGVTFKALLTTVGVVIHCASGVPTPSINVS